MKKLFILLIMIVFILISTIGCTTDKNSKLINENNLQLVHIKKLLVYDINTKIVYYYFKDTGIQGLGFGFMSPYISENGKFTKYDILKRKIIELK